MTVPLPRIEAAAPLAPARVLYLINGFQRGGAEQGLLRLIEGGAFAGCDLTVASIFEGSGDLLAAVRGAGVPVHALSAGERMTAGSLARAAAALPGLMRTLRPHALILSLPQANLLGRAVSRLDRPRVVASFEHNTHLAKPVYEAGWRLTSGWVDWLVADAAATAREVEARLYTRPPARRIVLPLVAFPSRSPPPPIHREGPLRLASAARFTPVKNQAALVRAAALLRDDGVDVRLSLYGEGPGREPCRRLAHELGLADRVELPGYRPRWWEAPHDLFVLASRHEGLCIAALEAMNAGVPVVAPHVGGLRDYADATTAGLVPDVEPRTLADAIARLAAQPERRAALAAAAFTRVQSIYGEAAVMRAYAAFAADLRALAR